MPQKVNLIINATSKNKNYWKDIWQFKELFYILSWRDVKVRYKQTVLGALWVLIKPLIAMFVFTFVFGYVAKLNATTQIPYAIIVFTGLLPWQFFSTALTEASNSLISNSNLISKVYFPRIIIPTSSVITSLIDFCISLLLLFCLCIWYKYVPSYNILVLPIFIILTLLAALGLGTFFSALNIKYRDFRYIVPFLVQLGLFISPVGFSTQQLTDKIGSKFKDIIYLNPMTGIIDGFRWCITNEALYLKGLFISITVILISLATGLTYFRKTERSFADNL